MKRIRWRRPASASLHPWLWIVLLMTGLSACAGTQTQQGVPTGVEGAVACENDRFASFERLLILAPHPDDEILGFAGLAKEFLKQGKSVETWVVTDGDAYCSACSLWTSGSVGGATCDAKTLSNFRTPAIDSLAEVRRLESRKAAEVLGLPAPRFMGYPDTGLATARFFEQEGDRDRALRRSDFSSCSSCDGCATGYGAGPATGLSSRTLTAALSGTLHEADARTLVATTHPLDGHGDHGALGSFVSALRSDNNGVYTLAFAVIHAHTPNGTAHADCWYPGPAAVECPCTDEDRADADPEWLAGLRAQRLRPDMPQQLPTDADYGTPVQLCLGQSPEENTAVTKARAIEEFATQTGTRGREAGMPSSARSGIMDCSGYLLSFARATEVFVLSPPH